MNIPGLYYIPNYLSKEELELIEIKLQTEKFKSITENSRKVVQYGYSYLYDRSGIEKLENDIPDIYLNIINPERINKIIGKEIIKNIPEQLIINEYEQGQGISSHIDHEKYFGDTILCLSVGSDIDIEFTYRYNISRKQIINIERGSLYIMSGDARYKWKHGINKTMDSNKKRNTRYSLTFRTIEDEYK